MVAPLRDGVFAALAVAGTIRSNDDRCHRTDDRTPNEIACRRGGSLSQNRERIPEVPSTCRMDFAMRIIGRLASTFRRPETAEWSSSSHFLQGCVQRPARLFVPWSIAANVPSSLRFDRRWSRRLVLGRCDRRSDVRYHVSNHQRLLFRDSVLGSPYRIDRRCWRKDRRPWVRNDEYTRKRLSSLRESRRNRRASRHASEVPR